jgi:radical SAM protein with 4Fe4S-binding SPASM domain
MELTERCNNNCVHCLINRPQHDLPAQVQEMSTVFVKNVLDQACDLGCLKVTFTGGEPLLRGDMKELYSYARQKGLLVSLFTNGRLLDQSWIDIFKEKPPGRPIELTTFGMTVESYDRVARQAGAYEEFQAAINLLRRNKIPFAVKIAVLNENKSDAVAYEKWIKSMGNQPQPVYVAHLSLRARRDSTVINDRILGQRITAGEAAQLFYNKSSVHDAMHDFCRQFAGPRGDTLFNCGMGDNLAVDAYGRLQGCLLLRHPDLIFDLARGTLRHALDEFFPLQKKSQATNKEYLARCAKCSLYGFCNQCPAQSFMEDGTLDTPVEYLCQMAHTGAEVLSLIPPGQKGWALKPSG